MHAYQSSGPLGYQSSGIFFYCFCFLPRNQNGNWMNVYTKRPVDLSFGVTGDMGGGQGGNCGAFIRSGWDNFLCTLNKAQPIHCACQHPRQIILQLRGLCPDSNLDKYYIPMNKERSGNVIYYGKRDKQCKHLTILLI